MQLVKITRNERMNRESSRCKQQPIMSCFKVFNDADTCIADALFHPTTWHGREMRARHRKEHPLAKETRLVAYIIAGDAGDSTSTPAESGLPSQYY